MPRFEPPVVYDRPPAYPRGTERLQCPPVDRTTNRFFSRFGGQPRGWTVLKTAGVYSTVDVPTQAQIDTASEVYLGGHVYEVSNVVAAALLDAGYTVTAADSLVLAESGVSLTTETGLPLESEAAA